MGNIKGPGASGGGGGGLTTVSNVGVGTGLSYRDVIGGTINFRRVRGINNIAVSTVGDEIKVDGAGLPGPSCAGIGSGAGVVELPTDAQMYNASSPVGLYGNFGCPLVVPCATNQFRTDVPQSSAFIAGSFFTVPIGTNVFDLQVERRDNGLGDPIMTKSSDSFVLGTNNAACDNALKTGIVCAGDHNIIDESYSIALGRANVSKEYSIAIGRGAQALGQNSIALGRNAIARIANTTVLARPITVPILKTYPFKTNAAVYCEVHPGAEIYLLTPEVDLTVVADNTITLPANTKIWITEVGLLLTTFSPSLSTQASVRFGITGTPDKLVSSVQTTLLTDLRKRQRFIPVLTDDGETDVVAGVTVGATGSGLVFRGRFYVKGLLMEV